MSATCLKSEGRCGHGRKSEPHTIDGGERSGGELMITSGSDISEVSADRSRHQRL